jgi:N-acyl-D-aspartate/D-glutamate deacylase
MIGLLLLLQINAANPVYDRVILGGHLMDRASGFDAVRNIGLLDGRIAIITTNAIRGRDTVDARNLVVAPGFIDVHAHGQTPETYRFQSLDGVTTSLELELGTSDVDAWYRERSAGERINYGVSIGHIKVRMSVMHDSGTVMPVSDGAYRAASPAEIGEIAKRIELGLSQGAVSIGAGFPYTPAATREELLAVFRVAAMSKTPMHVHIRPGVVGLREALSLAGETNASLQVVHINSAGLAETPTMLAMIRDARARGRDVTTEAYPYDAGMTEIKSATIQDVYKSASNERFAELEWPKTGERLNRESFERYSRIGGPIVVHTNTEPMVIAAITSPLTMIASDAYWQGTTGHPRTTGTFSRVLGHYVREGHALSLMDAIRKMTLMPAQRLEARVPEMKQKGRLRVGADADITVFDAARVIDRSTYREPSLSPVGIQHVIVNGVSVVANGQAVEGVAPGKAVRAPRTPGSGQWSARSSTGLTVGGTWTAVSDAKSGTVTGTWTLVDAQGKTLASGGWSASKSPDEWFGNWRAVNFGNDAEYTGSWRSGVNLRATAGFAELFEKALQSAVSGTWRIRDYSGTWSITAREG